MGEVIYLRRWSDFRNIPDVAEETRHIMEQPHMTMSSPRMHYTLHDLETGCDLAEQYMRLEYELVKINKRQDEVIKEMSDITARFVDLLETEE